MALDDFRVQTNDERIEALEMENAQLRTQNANLTTALRNAALHLVEKMEPGQLINLLAHGELRK